MDLLIRNIPAAILGALRARARERGRSVQAEALEALAIGIQPMGDSLFEWLKRVADPGIDVEAGLKAIRATRDER
ncbi:MAG: antitoxin [Candidatus Velthaea sp.]|jgi:plasmid stability protein